MEKSVVAAEHVTCGFAQFGLGLTKLADTVPDRTHHQGEHLRRPHKPNTHARTPRKSVQVVSVRKLGGLMDGLGIGDLDDTAG